MTSTESCRKQKLRRPQQTLAAQSADSHIHFNYGEAVRFKSGTEAKTKKNPKLNYLKFN